MDASEAIEIGIAAVVIIIVFVVLAPVVFSSTSLVTQNATYVKDFPTTVTVFTLLPLFFAIIALVVVVGLIRIKRR